MQTLVIGCETYYKKTFSEEIQDKMIFHDHIGFKRDDYRECTLELILDDIAEFQSRLSLDKVVIVGHSIHAYMATEYARRFPHKVEKIVLIGSGPYIDFEAADNYFKDFAPNDRKTALEYNFNLPPGHFAHDPFIDRMLRLTPMLWYDYNYDAKKLWEGIEFNNRAAEIIWGKMFENYKVPQLQHDILVMIGKYDFFNPPNLWENNVFKMDKSNLVLFEKSGHNPQLEERQLFNEKFLNFIT